MPSPDPDAASPAPPASSSPQLHNFPSFPVLKKWGTQRVLSCLRVNRHASDFRPPPAADSDARSVVGAKLLDHLRDAAAAAAADRLEPSPSPVEAADLLQKRRTRRRASFGPSSASERRVSLSPPAERGCRTRSLRLRSEEGGDRVQQRPKFSITLSAEEIAEDIYSVTGSLPRRRPRKRPLIIQKQLDALFPGSWLTEITAESYKVRD